MSLIVKARTPSSAIRCRSPSSTERAPTIAARVTDEICDRFCVLGNAEQASAKLKELEEIGVDQFNIYLMTHGQEEDLTAYGTDVIPQFA